MDWSRGLCLALLALAAQAPAAQQPSRAELVDAILEPYRQDGAAPELEPLLAGLELTADAGSLWERSRSPEPPRPHAPDDVWDEIERLALRLGEERIQGELEAALGTARELAGWTAARLPPDHWRVREAGRTLAHLERMAAAPPELRAALVEGERVPGELPRWIDAGELDMALRRIHARHELHRDAFGPFTEGVLESLDLLERLLDAAGADGAAGEAALAGLALWRELGSERHPDLALRLQGLALRAWYGGDVARAERCFAASLEASLECRGPHHADVAGAWINLGFALRRRGDLDGAARAYGEAMRIQRELGLQHSDVYAMVLFNRGRLHFEAGRWTDAEASYRESLALRRELYGEEHPEIADALGALGGLFLAQSLLPRAEDYHRQALEMRRRLFGDTLHSDLALSLQGLGRTLHESGRHGEGEALLREALAVLEELDRVDDEFDDIVRVQLAWVLSRTGEFEEAGRLIEEGLAGLVGLYGEVHAEVASALSCRGALHQAAGRYAEAERDLRRVVALREALLGERHVDVALARRDLVSLLRADRRLAEAEAAAWRALAVARDTLPPGSPTFSRFYNDLALIALDKGDPERARDLLEEALQIFEGRPAERSWLAPLRLNLAIAHLDAGDLEQAEARLEQERGERATRPSERGAPLARCLSLLAALQRERGALEPALELQREAVELLLADLGERDPEVAHAWAQLGAALLEMGGARELREAEPALERALALLRELFGPASPRLLAPLYHQGRLHDARGELEAAVACYRDAFAIAESQRTEILGAERERARFAERIGLAGLTAALVRDLVRLGRPAEALEVSERGRGRVLLDLLSRSGADPASTASSAGEDLELAGLAAAEEEALQALRLAESRRAALADREDLDEEQRCAGLEALRYAIRDLRVAHAEREAQLLAHLRGSWAGAGSASPRELAEALAPGELLLSYTWSPDAVLLLVLGTAPDGEPAVAGYELAADALAVAELAERVRREALAVLATRPGDVGDLGSARGAGRAPLVERLVPAPVRARLAEAARVVLVPDGPLVALPFDALFAAGEPAPPFCYATSATVYRQTRGAGSGASPRPAGAGGLRALVLGGGEPAAGGLPGAAAECRYLAGLVRSRGGQATVLQGDSASPERLATAAPDAQLLHLACHARTGSTERPYDADLRLGGDVRLSLEDLIRGWRGRLAGSELVVLSACETQRSARVGTSFMALSWGFLYAGAPTVVGSLWSVDDTATALLMSRFHENLLGHRGEPLAKLEALREAQRWLAGATRAELRRQEKRLGLELSLIHI